MLAIEDNVKFIYGYVPTVFELPFLEGMCFGAPLHECKFYWTFVS